MPPVFFYPFEHTDNIYLRLAHYFSHFASLCLIFASHQHEDDREPQSAKGGGDTGWHGEPGDLFPSLFFFSSSLSPFCALFLVSHLISYSTFHSSFCLGKVETIFGKRGSGEGGDGRREFVWGEHEHLVFSRHHR